MGAANVMQSNPQAKPAEGAPAEGGKRAAVVRNPFTLGSWEYTEPFHDRTTAMQASAAVANNDVPVAAAGFLKGVYMILTLATGSGGSAVLAGNAPWNVLQSVTLRDTNGQPILGPFTGYDLFLINKYGGYAFDPNPVNDPNYSALTSSGNGSLVLYMPVEASERDAFCALPNTSSSQPYKIDYTIAPGSDVFTTPPATTYPTVNVQMVGEYWAPPADFDIFGTPNELAPPSLGSLQKWTRATYNINAGEQKVNLTRVGNLIRNLVCVFYNDASPSVRANEFPTKIRWELDNITRNNEPTTFRNSKIRQRYGFAPDTGVLVLDFAHDLDGHPGHEQRGQYVPTKGASKLTLEGTFLGGGTLHVLTNEILPAPSQGVMA